ncbi:ROK family glucokinase [Oenococcus kitaharae]|uniref:Glucokinase n=1 Tax=Oenococcus kitaharae DSM 17330 TaxID=1045004 RepID=G9WG30_9LACO|nr:ROK family glucokinase [Oenococcus kitaharae]EHN59608.1 Glucokinase [Oenococcus kitaharae DSM 17330]OEY83452.1 glucokinase [Oenococcus kitaharae]OEY85251.1 glucokinase [Oenococcus kitaharae]OEY86105.1 glucokinase [Oenococcus kitaharae]
MAKDKLIGVDLGGTTIKFAILTDTGEIQEKWSVPTNILDNGSHIVPDIIDSINARLDLLKLDRDRIIGIGMGTPGTVNREKGTVEAAYNLNWKNVQHVRDQIQKSTGLNFTMDNDANSAAIGEQWKGAGENNPNVSFITLGTGVGGGIIANGQMVRGVFGAGGEFGHMVVQPGGYLCTCGNHGCLEQYCSATGVVHLARDFADEYEGDSKLKAMLDNGDEVTSKIVFDLAKGGDFLANEVVNKMAYYLGYATAALSNILNPAYVVIGGGVSAAGDFLLDKVKANWTKYAFSSVRSSTKLRLAALGNDAGVIGAASLAREFIEK